MVETTISVFELPLADLYYRGDIVRSGTERFCEDPSILVSPRRGKRVNIPHISMYNLVDILNS